MDTLELKKKTAIKLFKAGSKEVQDILLNSFGNELFTTKIIDRVTSVEDAWELADEQTRKECQVFPTDTPDVVAYKNLKLIIKVINEDFIPDWKNTNQRKWFPVFNLASGSGFVFSGSDYLCTNTYSYVGSRLCFETEEKSNYVANHFIELYKSLLTLNK